MTVATLDRAEVRIPARCESGNVRRDECIGFYSNPGHSWFLPMWSPDREHNTKAYALLAATFPEWYTLMRGEA